MKSLAIASVLALALSAPSYAADLDSKYPTLPGYAQPAANSWSGPYIGLFGGWAGGNADVYASEEVRADPDRFLPGWDSFSTDGWLLGIQAGYDFQPGGNKFVFGVVGDVSWGAVNDKNSRTRNVYDDTGEVVVGTETVYDKFEVNTLATVRGRAGYLVNNQTLVYGTGGIAFAWTKLSAGYRRVYDGEDALVYSGSGSDRQTHIGYVVGAGAEYRPAKNWSLGLEYLYAGFGEETYSKDDISVGADLDTHIVKAGVNYRF